MLVMWSSGVSMIQGLLKFEVIERMVKIVCYINGVYC